MGAFFQRTEKNSCKSLAVLKNTKKSYICQVKTNDVLRITCYVFNEPGANRTRDQRLKRPLLYLAELRAHNDLCEWIFICFEFVSMSGNRKLSYISMAVRLCSVVK
jgi:hypothetical protein